MPGEGRKVQGLGDGACTQVQARVEWVLRGLKGTGEREGGTREVHLFPSFHCTVCNNNIANLKQRSWLSLCKLN